MKEYKDPRTGTIYQEPEYANEYLQQIYLLSIDYDGCHNVKDLKALIDEIVDLSNKAMDCLYEGKIINPKDKEKSDGSTQT